MSHEAKTLEERAAQANAIAEHLEQLMVEYVAAPNSEDLVLFEQIHLYAQQYKALTGKPYVRQQSAIREV